MAFISLIASRGFTTGGPFVSPSVAINRLSNKTISIRVVSATWDTESLTLEIVVTLESSEDGVNFTPWASVRIISRARSSAGSTPVITCTPGRIVSIGFVRAAVEVSEAATLGFEGEVT